MLTFGTSALVDSKMQADIQRQTAKKRIAHIPYPVWNGEIIVPLEYNGTWRLKGDTLFMMCNPNSAEVQMDTTHISYRPEMRDSVRNMIARYINVKKLKEELRKDIEEDLLDTFPVTTNRANDKIEMIVSRSDDNVSTHYLRRIKEGN